MSGGPGNDPRSLRPTLRRVNRGSSDGCADATRRARPDDAVRVAFQPTPRRHEEAAPLSRRRFVERASLTRGQWPFLFLAALAAARSAFAAARAAARSALFA